MRVKKNRVADLDLDPEDSYFFARLEESEKESLL
jgi:hypothetical protein